MHTSVELIVDITNYFIITLTYANVFIALFIATYAWLFLKKTNEHRDRRPWDFLFVASILYLIFAIFNIFYNNGLITLLGSSFNIELTRNIFSFMYSGCVLLAFISQHDLILRSELILISKKESTKVDVKEQPSTTNNTTTTPTTSKTTQKTESKPRKSLLSK